MAGPYRLPPNAMVSQEGPQSMGSPLQALLKLMGIGSNNQDIELPPQGPRDPRLPGPDVQGMLKSGATGLDPVGGLKRAFGR